MARDRRRGPGRRGPSRAAGRPSSCIAVVALLASPFIALVPAMAERVRARRGEHSAWARPSWSPPRGSARWPGPWPCPAWPCGSAGCTMLRSRAVRRARAAVRLRPRPDLWLSALAFVAVGAGVHLRAVGTQHGGAAAGPGRGPGPDPQHLHDGPRARLPAGRRAPGRGSADAHGIRAVTVVGALVLLALLAVAVVPRRRSSPTSADSGADRGRRAGRTGAPAGPGPPAVPAPATEPRA